MTKLKDMNEKELREVKDFWPQTEKDLIKYIHSLVDRPHEYGTCVYAMSLSAVAALNYVAHELEVTGFQASCADMDILKRTLQMEDGFMILDYHHPLLPQYCNEKYFPDWRSLLEKNKVYLKPKAEKMLTDDTKLMHPNVRKHLEMIVNL